MTFLRPVPASKSPTKPFFSIHNMLFWIAVGSQKELIKRVEAFTNSMSARQIGEGGHLMGDIAKLEHFHFAFRGVGRRGRNRILVSTIFLSMFVLWRKEEGTRRCEPKYRIVATL
jgi:hypothetical protein